LPPTTKPATRNTSSTPACPAPTPPSPTTPITSRSSSAPAHPPRAATAKTLYSYDGQGNRVKKVVNGNETNLYVYDAFGKLAAEYKDSGTPTPGTFYRTVDHLGSTRLVTDAAGTEVERTDYLPFGEEILVSFGDTRHNVAAYGSSGLLRHKFAGKERDSESGMDYFLARYYSSPMGRFTSPDIPFADQTTAAPQSWNLYTHTRNNPLKYVDENGNFLETAWDIANVVWGVKSLVENVRAGNYGAAAVDAVGVVVDTASVVVPGAPGGAGTAIKAARGAETVVSTAKALNKVDNVADGRAALNVADDAGTVGKGPVAPGDTGTFGELKKANK